MSYFSRLTDIVTCNLSALLAEAEDPQAALSQIIREIDEGLSGARRSVSAATASEQRLLGEISEHRKQSADWAAEARRHVASGRDDEARQALLRKREVENLIAGLEQQHAAAVTTREHLTTTLKALDARLAEARRRQTTLASPSAAAATSSSMRHEPTAGSQPDEQLEAELEALRREVGGK